MSDCRLLSLRGHLPDEELGRAVELRKLLTGGGTYFSWSQQVQYLQTVCPVYPSHFQGPQQALDLTMSAQKTARFPGKSDSRFFWTRSLWVPYLRAGVDCKTWLGKSLPPTHVNIGTLFIEQ